MATFILAHLAGEGPCLKGSRSRGDVMGIRCLLILLLAMALPCSAAAQPVGPEFQVNTFTTLGQRSPSVASDASGNFVVVWQSSRQDGLGLGVFGQRYDSSGNRL